MPCTSSAKVLAYFQLSNETLASLHTTAQDGECIVNLSNQEHLAGVSLVWRLTKVPGPGLNREVSFMEVVIRERCSLREGVIYWMQNLNSATAHGVLTLSLKCFVQQNM